MLGRAEQHGGMTIVTAGVHLPGHSGFVRNVAGFLDRQRVHVRAQADDLAALALLAANDTDHAGLANARNHLVTPELAQFVGDQSGGTVDVVLQFGVGVDIVAPGFNVIEILGQTVDQRHKRHSLRGADPGGQRLTVLVLRRLARRPEKLNLTTMRKSDGVNLPRSCRKDRAEKPIPADGPKGLNLTTSPLDGSPPLCLFIP